MQATDSFVYSRLNLSFPCKHRSAVHVKLLLNLTSCFGLSIRNINTSFPGSVTIKQVFKCLTSVTGVRLGKTKNTKS